MDKEILPALVSTPTTKVPAGVVVAATPAPFCTWEDPVHAALSEYRLNAASDVSTIVNMALKSVPV